jgi:2-polyprenyl-3-methyl-5-hydroxy-6-metoxy-1,4-benzoquinol methylase
MKTEGSVSSTETRLRPEPTSSTTTRPSGSSNVTGAFTGARLYSRRLDAAKASKLVLHGPVTGTSGRHVSSPVVEVEISRTGRYRRELLTRTIQRPGARVLPGTAELYDRWHRERFERYGKLEPTAPWHLMARKHLTDGSLKGQQVLEIGCGAGQFAQWLAEQGGDVLAGDFSAEACRLARSNISEDVEVEQLDAQNLVEPLGHNRFDLVCCLETLEHVPDHNRALREIVAVTKPGGRIIVSTPNYLSPTGLNRAIMRLFGRRYTEMGQPVNNVLVGIARKWKLRRLGCRIEAFEGSGYAFAILGTKRTVTLGFLRPFKALAFDVLVVATKR